MVKFDPHNNERYYKRWKDQGSPIFGVTDENKAIILQFIGDMEVGANVNPSSSKGARSFGRLRNLRAKMVTMLALFEEHLSIRCAADLENKDVEILRFFKRFRDGELSCRWTKKKPLKAIRTYAKVFKSFWHWYQRSERRKGRDVRDITADLDCRGEKPKFTYFTIDDLKKLCNSAKYDYKVMMMFMFDSGIRSPTELMNVMVSDLEWNEKGKYYTLTIREETSKTFGRKIKLLLCSEILKEYIENEKLPPNYQIFKKSPSKVNLYIKRLGFRILNLGQGEIKTSKGKRFPAVKEGLTMYDFRHSSACYWLLRYKSEAALKYRFGWKRSDMIYYYTELLGMRDTIETDDLYTDITKTELEQQITQKGKEMELMQERMQEQDKKLKEIMDILKALQMEKLLAEPVLQTPR